MLEFLKFYSKWHLLPQQITHKRSSEINKGDFASLKRDVERAEAYKASERCGLRVHEPVDIKVIRERVNNREWCNESQARKAPKQACRM